MERTDDNVRPIWHKIANWFNKHFKTEEYIVSAQEAFCCSTYGCQISLDDRIKICQHQINTLIQLKMKPEKNIEGDISCCHCAYVIPDDMTHYAAEIFQPFKEKGFAVRNVKQYIFDIEDSNLYLISWNHKKF